MIENQNNKTWRNFEAAQQPLWPNKTELDKVLFELSKLPALVFSGETRNLISEIENVNNGSSFILQVGNCAESFTDCNGVKIHNFLRILLQMSMVLNFKTGKNIIKIGRVAGQYAKPRSTEFENINGQLLPSYRGDNVNSIEADYNKRIPDPNRLIEGYFRSAATLNLIRAFFQGGYNDIQNIKSWEDYYIESEIFKTDYYNKLKTDITQSLDRHKYNAGEFVSNYIYTSHEGLLLEYEEVFTRLDTVAGGYYDTSAHFLWIGERTRKIDGAHVEFFSGVGNPVGIKVGRGYDTSEIIKTIIKLNKENKKGKIVLIPRMGKQFVNELNPLIVAVKDKKLNVTWVCDPMHGNTYTYKGCKVRSFNDITQEIKSFFEICKQNSILPGGVHLEITDENVTECEGGINGLTLSQICSNYTTKVDPRLNASQALELSFVIGDLLNEYI